MRPRASLVVMLKEPRPGRVKTRLGQEIGMAPAAWWFRHQVAALLRRLRDPRWRLVLAVSPDTEGLKSRVWPPDLERWPQGQGDLGDRMARIFRDLPGGEVVIVGADIPGIRRHHIARSLQILGSAEAVIGPADDGGFWLIGMARRRPPPAGLFTGVRWSGEHAMTDTLATLRDRKVGFADTLSDVDTVQDLRSLRALSK